VLAITDLRGPSLSAPAQERERMKASDWGVDHCSLLTVGQRGVTGTVRETERTGGERGGDEVGSD
jgi:hypothetical protein